MSITLGLEGAPVEWGGVLDGETVVLGVVDCLGEGRSIVSDLFGNASTRQ